MPNKLLKTDSGKSAQKGFAYQRYVGVLRALQFCDNEDLMSIQYESIDEGEDINLHYMDKVVMEQVKTKSSGSWSPSEFKPIIAKFSDKLNKTKENGYEKIAVEFHFTTNNGWNKDLKTIMSIVNKIQEKQFLNFKLSEDEKKCLSKIKEKNVDIEQLIDVLKVTTFNWYFHVSGNPFDEIEEIKKQSIAQIYKQITKTINSVNNPETLSNKIYNLVGDHESNMDKRKEHLTKEKFSMDTGLINRHDVLNKLFNGNIEYKNPYYKQLFDLKCDFMKYIPNMKGFQNVGYLFLTIQNVKIGIWFDPKLTQIEKKKHRKAILATDLDKIYFVVKENNNLTMDRYKDENIIIVTPNHDFNELLYPEGKVYQ